MLILIALIIASKYVQVIAKLIKVYLYDINAYYLFLSDKSPSKVFIKTDFGNRIF